MKKVLVAAIAAVMALCMAGCQKGSEVQVPVQSVSEIVGLGALGVAQRFAGVVSVQDPVKIMKNADTKIGEIMVKEGDDVKEGDVLFVYDTDQLNLDLEKAKLELEKLWNDITNMQNERAELEKEKANAPSDQQLQYSLEINSKDTEILEANYNSQVKQKEIESLEKSLENATVKATVSGRIGTITDGEQTDATGNPAPLITIVQTNDLLVKGSINENNIYSMTPGMSVIIRSRIDDQTWKGTLAKVDMDNPVQNQEMYMAFDTGDGTANSSKYPFTVELENADGLMLGQHVYVEPDNGQGEDGSENWYLPAWYIVSPESNPYVWAQGSNGKLEKRGVALGEHSPEDMNMDSYIITSGLSLEDKIAFPDENMTEGAVCVDYREYVPPADETGGAEDMPAVDDGMEMPVAEDGIAEEYMTDMPETYEEIIPEGGEGETVTGAWETPEYPEEETTGGGN